MALTGSLEEFPLVPLIRLFEASRSTGLLQIRNGSEKATLGFASGSLVAASCGSDRGDLGLAAATALTDGTFQWSAGPQPEAELKGTNDEILARASALAETLATARRVIPDDGARFALAGGDAADRTLAVKRHQWRVLSVVDGRRDVDGIARASGEGKLATLRTLSELLEKGLISMSAAAPAKPKRPRAPKAPRPIEAVAPPDDPAREPPAEDADPRAAVLLQEPLRPPRDEGLMSIDVAEPEEVSAAAPEEVPGAALPTPIDQSPDGAPTIVADHLSAELDARLAAIAAIDVPEAEAAADMTQVIVSHYLPPTVERPVVEQPKEKPKGGGFFGLFRGSTTKEQITLPAAEQLARLANALLLTAAQTAGSQPSQSAVEHLKQLYQTKPVGHRVPTREAPPLLGARVPDLVDEEAIASDPASDKYLPVLAALVQHIREVEGRAMGHVRATSIYRDAVAEVFGEPRHKSATTVMIKNVATVLASARVTVRMGGPSGPYDLVGRECTIGRSSSNHIVLEDSSVSGQHARLIPRPDGFTIVDLGSRNGTRVNGEKIQGQRVLTGGEVVGIGEAILDFELLAK